jgi:predicted RNA binding protein YcfA (HicA-like mRNA interferase family)
MQMTGARLCDGFFTTSLCDEISDGDFVPQKIRELVAELERAGFINRGGKGSHRNFAHPKVSKPITISGALGDDAKQYQVRAVKSAVEESKS